MVQLHRRATLAALLGCATIAAFGVATPKRALGLDSPPPAPGGGNTHEMQITVATTGSPFVPTGWSGGTVHIGIEFYIGWNYIPPRMNLMVPLSPGPTPCVLAQQICNAINDHSVLHAEGYRARRVDNTVFVTGPYVKDCPGTVDKPALDGDANRVQTRTAVHKL